jgi:hypothetical protein
MLDKILELLEKTDSYKKVVLLLLTGIASLAIYVSYRVSEIAIIRFKNNSIPVIYDSHSACSVIEVRPDVFIITFAFPVPAKLNEVVFRYSVGFWVKERPSTTEVRDLCDNLMKATASDRAEKLLAPYIEMIEDIDKK